MSNPDKTGGPAFPQPDIYHPNGQVEYGATGLTLLDYIAIHAMQGMLAADSSPTAADLGECAYKAARNMLAAKAMIEAADEKPVATCPGCLAGSPDQGEGHDITCAKNPNWIPF